MLDVICSALGVFMILFLITPPPTPAVCPVCPPPAPTPAPLTCPICPPPSPKCVTDTFLLVRVEWDTEAADVDLYVTDNEGNACGYHRSQGRKCPGSKMEWYYDYKIGGKGPEIVLVPVAKPGRYTISWNLYSGEYASNVRGEVRSSRTTIKIPSRSITKSNSAYTDVRGSRGQTVLEFNVDDKGDIVNVVQY